MLHVRNTANTHIERELAPYRNFATQLSQVVSSVHSLRAGQTECLSFRQGLSTSENSHRMSRLVTVADWSWVVGTLRGSGFDFFFQVAREIS